MEVETIGSLMEQCEELTQYITSFKRKQTVNAFCGAWKGEKM